MNNHIEFPEKNEYPSYAEMYMQLIKKDGYLIKQLKDNLEETKKLVNSLTTKELEYRYAIDKWSIKEVLLHIVDDERIYAYRALAFARNDKTILPGFEQDDYAKYSDENCRSIKDIMSEYEAVRLATIELFKGFSDKALMRIGSANGNKTSVRALGYHIAGHELHHIIIIKERYLNEDQR